MTKLPEAKRDSGILGREKTLTCQVSVYKLVYIRIVLVIDKAKPFVRKGRKATDLVF